jgi:uncharacterized membrane protein YeaQ/YmgE (transglycosylase-associated protein family)
MNLLIYLIVAAVIGWVATELMHDRSNLLLNIVVAVVGAFLAGYFLSPVFHVGTINDAFTIPTMLMTLVGSVILLVLVNLVRGNGRRRRSA